MTAICFSVRLLRLFSFLPILASLPLPVPALSLPVPD